MLVIQIALGILLAIFVIANFEALVSLVLWGMVAIIGIGLALLIISNFSDILSGVSYFMFNMPAIFLMALILVGVVSVFSILGALAAVILKRFLSINFLMKVEFEDLAAALKVNLVVFAKAAVRYVGERAAYGLFYVFYPSVVLLALTAIFDQWLENLVISFVGAIVLFACAIFLHRIYVNRKASKSSLS